MIAVIQRTLGAKVKVNSKIISKIEQGMVVLLGIQKGDTINDAHYVAKKISSLRIFNDEHNKMNRSIKEVNGSALVISQFTLCANIKKGNRPSFIHAEDSKPSRDLYDYFIEVIIRNGVTVKTGEFGAMMDVELVNNGPSTFIVESKN
ncbi:MAG: D-tyrosyl-tRNA(Tyr) deacylase [Candidatus Marinimicrobia bacterium]|nr:D-tyrosyl-tRNA(Tyr) deacylase [Candidatus Neomarinimicrobiota bacterium]